MHIYATCANMTGTRWCFCYIYIYIFIYTYWILSYLCIFSRYLGEEYLAKYFLKGLKPPATGPVVFQFSIEVWPFVEDTVRSWPVFLTWVESSLKVVGLGNLWMLTCMMLMKVRELGGGIRNGKIWKDFAVPKSHHPRGLALNLESSLVVFSLQCVTVDGGLFFFCQTNSCCVRDWPALVCGMAFYAAWVEKRAHSWLPLVRWLAWILNMNKSNWSDQMLTHSRLFFWDFNIPLAGRSNFGTNRDQLGLGYPTICPVLTMFHQKISVDDFSSMTQDVFLEKPILTATCIMPPHLSTLEHMKHANVGKPVWIIKSRVEILEWSKSGLIFINDLSVI